MAEKAIESMSDDELIAMINQARGVKDEGTTTQNQGIRVQLADGTVVQAQNEAEMNRLLQAKLDEYRHQEDVVATPPPVAPVPQGQKPEWDYDKFSKTFVKDPREGLDYLETVRYGAPVSNLIPVLVQALAQQNQKLQQIEAQQFIDSHEDYNPSVENRRALEGIITERGWQTTRQSLDDAFAIAVAQGKIKATPVEREESKNVVPFIPPRTGRVSTTEEDMTLEQINQAAYEMPMDKLEDLMIKNNLLRTRHN